jgi:Ca2+-binding RTX toxin-like protein
MRRAVAAGGVVALAVAAALAAAPADAQNVPCPLIGFQPIQGTPGSDAWQGTPQPEIYEGLAGDDRIDGGDGDDCLIGGAGADVVLGAQGKDALNGLDGADTLDGGPGPDTVEGGDQRDRLLGGDGDDTLTAADLLPDTIDCGPGADTARVDRFDRPVGCERVERMAYNDSWLDLRWRVTDRGVIVTRGYARGVRGRGTVGVGFRCRGGPGCENGAMLHLTRTRGRRNVRLPRLAGRRLARGERVVIAVRPGRLTFTKLFVLRVRRYGNPRAVKQPFRITAHCSVPGHDRILSSDRCKRVFRRR